MSSDILTIPPPPYDLKISYGPAPQQFGHLRLPSGNGPHPVVVVIHGGFWRATYDLEYAGHLSSALTKQGYATWNIEYRRLGDPGGGYPGTLDDASAAVAFLPQVAEAHKLDITRVAVLGHSAGGHLALWLATRPNSLRAVIALAAVADLRLAHQQELSRSVVADLLGGSPDEVPERYRAASPMDRLPLRAKAVLLHGEDDDIVPVGNSVQFARESGAKLVRLPHTGHFEPVDPRTAAWQTVVAELRSLLTSQ